MDLDIARGRLSFSHYLLCTISACSFLLTFQARAPSCRSLSQPGRKLWCRLCFLTMYSGSPHRLPSYPHPLPSGSSAPQHPGQLCIEIHFCPVCWAPLQQHLLGGCLCLPTGFDIILKREPYQVSKVGNQDRGGRTLRGHPCYIYNLSLLPCSFRPCLA